LRIRDTGWRELLHADLAVNERHGRGVADAQLRFERAPRILASGEPRDNGMNIKLHGPYHLASRPQLVQLETGIDRSVGHDTVGERLERVHLDLIRRAPCTDDSLHIPSFAECRDETVGTFERRLGTGEASGGQ